jgi:hypothetical protein
MGKCFSFSRLFFIAFASTLIVSTGFAAVPASYKGKPYKGTPRAIPGVVFWADFDIGGGAKSSIQDNVWYADNTDNGDWKQVKGFRAGDGDSDHPVVYGTNEGWVDTRAEDKSIFPSADSAKSYFYIGCSHPNDWYSVTVDVKNAGVYKLSSTWATEWVQSINFHLEFNYVKTPIDINGVKTEVVDLGNTPQPEWHTWKRFDNFGKVTLEKGVQVLRWCNHKSHLNNCYLQFDADFVEILPNFWSSSPTALEQVLTIYPASGKSLKNIQYTICEPGQTSLNIYDCSGKVVKAVFNRNLSAGKYNEQLDLSNITNGAYFINLNNNNKRSIAKINYVR